MVNVLRIAAMMLLGIAIQVAAKAIELGETYRITSKSCPTRSLFVKDSRRAAETDIILWTETDVPSAQWKLLNGTGGTFVVQNVYTGHYAAPRTRNAGGSFATTSTRANGKLVIEAADGDGHLFRIMNSNRSLALTALADEDGSLPVWAEISETNEAQLWLFEPVAAKPTFTTAMRDEMLEAYVSQHLHSRGGSHRTFCDGGWGEAEQLEVLIDAYETTGEERYLNYARQVYSYFTSKVGSDWTRGASTGYQWFGYDFNDDVMWMVIAVARMGYITANKAYTNAAKANFDRIYERAFIPFTGLLRWAEQTGDRFGTNSCINGPAEVAACYLAMSGCGETYFEKARDLYASQRRHLAQNMATGRVWDSVVWDPQTERVKSKNEWASTYNQGTMLGAACLLYKNYGDAQYLSDARKIMNYTKSNLCDGDGIINVCQDPENPDLCGFKGILMRYVRLLVTDLGQDTYSEWMLRNALHAYCNRAPSGLTGTGWLTKSTEATTENAFACSTAASAAANAPFDVQQDDAVRDMPCEAQRQDTSSTARGCYSLSGMSLPEPPTGGICIIRSNGKARKVLHR